MASYRVNREKFLNQLNSVKSGLPARGETVEQSSCFVFKDGVVFTCNAEVFCSTPSFFKEERGATPALKLLGNLEKWTDEEIEMDWRDSEIIISGRRRSCGLRLEREILLNTDYVEVPRKWSPLPENFGEAVKIVSSCASNEDTLFSLLCVHFHPKYIEACDNLQITRYRMVTGVSEEFLIRHDSLKNLSLLDMVLHSETPTWMHFKNSQGTVLSCRRYLDKFPDFTSFVESEGGELLTLPKGLGEAVNIARIFSEENGQGNRVTVKLLPDRVIVRGDGVTGWYQEVGKVRYGGKPMEFAISPKMLIDISKRHSQCQVKEGLLKVNGGSYTYVSRLFHPNGKPQELPEEKPIKKKIKFKKR